MHNLQQTSAGFMAPDRDLSGIQIDVGITFFQLSLRGGYCIQYVPPLQFFLPLFAEKFTINSLYSDDYSYRIDTVAQSFYSCYDKRMNQLIHSLKYNTILATTLAACP